MSMYRFERLIKKYSNTFTVQKSSEDFYDEDTGEYVEGTDESVTLTGMIAPLKSDQIYDSGGRLTEADRALYIFEPLPYKTRIQYKDITYSVEAAVDYSDFGNFYYYVLKAVSAFND